MGFSLNNPLPSSMRSKSLSRTAIGCVAETWMRLRLRPAAVTSLRWLTLTRKLILILMLTCCAGECRKTGKILASFVDPRQSFGPDKIIPPSVLANAKVREPRSLPLPAASGLPATRPVRADAPELDTPWTPIY